MVVKGNFIDYCELKDGWILLIQEIMVKLRYFRHYIIIKIGDVIPQTFWQYGGRSRFYRHEWVGNTGLFYCFNIIINLANGLCPFPLKKKKKKNLCCCDSKFYINF